jgi:hypothetical protein
LDFFLLIIHVPRCKIFSKKEFGIDILFKYFYKEPNLLKKGGWGGGELGIEIWRNEKFLKFVFAGRGN